MKRFLVFTFAALTLAATAAAQGTAAQSDQQQSVADVARQLKKQRATTPPPHRTFTNDDLPHDRVVNVSGASTADADTDKPKSDDASDATNSAAKDAKDGKDIKDKPATGSDTEQKEIAAWQSRLAAQRKEVSDLEHEIDILNREHQLRVAQFYWDAGNRLRDDKKWAEDEQKHNDDVADKTAKLQAAREKLDQMKEDARKAGVPGGAVE